VARASAFAEAVEIDGALVVLVTALRIGGMLGGLAVLTSWGIERFHALMARVPFPFLQLSRSPQVAHQQVAAYQHAVAAATFGAWILGFIDVARLTKRPGVVRIDLR